jgi:hypothetical protein
MPSAVPPEAMTPAERLAETARPGVPLHRQLPADIMPAGLPGGAIRQGKGHAWREVTG